MRKLIIGNWKMNPKSLKEAEMLAKELVKSARGKKNTTVVICPPAPYLIPLKKIFGKVIGLGAQNAFFEMEGAHTGEISPKMLASIGVSHVILGHSERRNPPTGGGETDHMINKKVLAVLASGLTPVLCVGERERDDAHAYLQVIKTQLEIGLAGVQKTRLGNVIIAYEPIWAIGKDASRVATPEESREMSVFIRKVIADMFGQKESAKVRVIYGGSVDEKNGADFLANGGVEGLLPGRLSLQPKKFIKILK